MTVNGMVKSPAGETIEVVSDEDWAALCDLNDARHVRAYWQATRGPIVTALWEHGAYVDTSGFAATLLWQDAKARGYTGAQSALNGLWRGPLGPAISRDTRGKRTSRVQLIALPQTWLDRLTANGDQTSATEAVDATLDAIAELVEDSTDDGFDQAIQLEVAQSVASALLAQVVDIIATGKPDTSRLDALEAEAGRLTAREIDLSQRLANQVADSDHLRRKLRDVEDVLAATKTERDGLRQRLRMTEANLSKAIDADRHGIIQDAVNVELAKVMRATPIHRSPDDQLL